MQVLAYEIRVPEGYGMRWAQDRANFKQRTQPYAEGALEALIQNIIDTLRSEAKSEHGECQATIFSEPEALLPSPEASSIGPVTPTVIVPWIFRGFVEPMMEGGHEVGWRH